MQITIIVLNEIFFFYNLNGYPLTKTFVKVFFINK